MAATEQSGTKGRLRIAVDIGGTFTDLAAFDEAEGRLMFGKALSTHGALVDGIQNTMDGAGVNSADAYLFLHGSTIAINTLLERNGANTALLITEGFRDIYEIGRVNRPDAYNLFFSKHAPLVKRSSRFEVSERLLADGSVHKKLDEDAVRALARVAEGARHRVGRDPASSLLSQSGARERVKEMVREELPDAFVSASHELSPGVSRVRASFDGRRQRLCRAARSRVSGATGAAPQDSRASAAISSSCSRPAACFPSSMRAGIASAC